MRSPGSGKFRNKAIVVDGERFDSLKEHRRWQVLTLLQKAGEITDLQRQVRFKMVVNDQLVCAYVADATYREAGVLIVEDVKSPPTRANPVYRIKKKMLKACHGLEIREV